MSKKIPKVKKSNRKKLDSHQQHMQAAKKEDDQDDRLNFGGLPDRNLKKNLGCG